MFNPLTWALGFAATRAALAAWSEIKPSELATGLRRACLEWSESLPVRFLPKAHSQEALLSFLFEDSGAEHATPSRNELSNSLEQGLLPSEELWARALVEQWEWAHNLLGDDANPFFSASRGEVAPHLDELAKQLWRVTMRDQPRVNRDVLSAIEDIHAMLAAEGMLPRQKHNSDDAQSLLTRDIAHSRIRTLLEDGVAATRKVEVNVVVNNVLFDACIVGEQEGSLFDAQKTNLINLCFLDGQSSYEWSLRTAFRAALLLRRDRQSHHRSTLLIVAASSWLKLHREQLESDLQDRLPAKPKGRNRVRFVEWDALSDIGSRALAVIADG